MKKNKKSILLVIILTIVIIIGGIGASFFYYKRTIKKIKNSYNETVITKTKINLYDSKKINIGTIEKGFILPLESIKKIGFNNRFFQIKNTPYYVYYKDVEKSKKTTNSESNYLLFNKNIISDNVELLENDKVVITLNKIDMPILSLDDNNYYVSFLNKVLTIKKSKFIKEKDVKNTEDKEADHISVLYYEKVEEKCNEYICTTTEKLKNQLNKLKENGFYTIDTDTYKKYLNGNVRLKEKAVYIITNDINDQVKNAMNETKLLVNKLEETDNFKFNSTNKTSNKESDKNSINRYALKSYSNDDNVIRMANGEEVYEAPPVINSGQGIPVLNYHFFYDSSIGEWCEESICLDTSKFRQHLQYLKDNNYKALTMNEFVRWMYGEIDLPEKSVLITIDDGAAGTGKHNGNKLIPLLEEYKMHATLFLITGWWGIENYQSEYLDIQSHTHDMHQYGSCGRGQINCATYEEAMQDLANSISVVKNTDSFCFPFYMTSETSLRAVKNSGFKVAFVGGSVKAKRTNNKWLIPRYPIHSDITMNQFINMVN